MIVNQPEQKKKKLALVANSAWSVYNFRMDLIHHLLLSFDVLIIAPKDDFAEELKRRAVPTWISISITVPRTLCGIMLYLNPWKRYTGLKNRILFFIM